MLRLTLLALVVSASAFRIPLLKKELTFEDRTASDRPKPFAAIDEATGDVVIN
eukprot:g2633.t1